MKRTTLPLINGKLSLSELAEKHGLDRYDKNDLVVIECEPGWYVLLAAGALQELTARLQNAINRTIAKNVLNMPLGEVLKPIAKQSDTPPAGPSRRPPIATADALMQALGVDPQALNHQTHAAMKPDDTDAIKEIDALDQISGGGAAGGDASGGSSKGDLGSVAESIEPAPPPPPPPTTQLQREDIRLDVVTPETAVVNEPFDMAVAIRQPASPTLSVDDLPKLTSAMGEVYRTGDQDLIKYRVEVEVDDCDVKPAHYDFLLAKGRDSIIQYFQLTPKRAGNLSVVVNAYQADSEVLAATTRVRLKAGVAVASDASGAVQVDTVKLYDALTGLFDLNDVQDLAIRLGINWDELAGDNLSARCRSLLTYCGNRGKLDQLRQLVKAQRPDAAL
jgi:hypothetical protein